MATRKTSSKSGATRKRTTAPSRSAATRGTSAAGTRKRAAVSEPAAVETVEVVEVAAARGNVYNRYPVAALIAEFLGTFLFVAFAVVTQVNPLYAFFGLIAIVTLFGRLSGPHLNPAVTIGAWLARFVSGRTAVFYIIAQILGGLAAFGVLSLLSAATGASATSALTASTGLYKLTALTATTEWYIFAGELIGAIIFGFGVASALTRNNSLARGVVYGGSFLIASFIVYASGAFAVLNPVLAGALQGYSYIDWKSFNLFPVLVYAIAPIVGASLGFGLARLVEKSTVTE